MWVFDLVDLIGILLSGRYTTGAFLILLAICLSVAVSPWLLLVALPGIALIVWKYRDDQYWKSMEPADRPRREWD